MTGIFGNWLQTIRRIFPQRQHPRRFVAGKQTNPLPTASPMTLRWFKRRGVSLLGWPGMASIGLLSICPAFYFSAILPVQEKLAATSNSVVVLQEQIKHAGREAETGIPASQRAPEEQLGEFYRMFPESKNMPDHLEKIFSMAQTQGIRLDQGEYKVTRSKEGNLVSFQMNLPVTGEYPQIRKFLAALMADMPALSLQKVQFKRQKADNPLVEANISLLLYLMEQRS